MSKLIASKLRVRVKELAQEARYIRHEEKKHKGQDKYELQLHRTRNVRNAAREVLLALGMLYGTPYARMERKVHDVYATRAYTLPRAVAAAKRFGVDDKCVTEWMAAATEHLKCQQGVRTTTLTEQLSPAAPAC